MGYFLFGNSSLRARVSGRFPMRFALTVIFIWITLAGNTARESTRECDLTLLETYEKIIVRFLDDEPNEDDIPTVLPGNCDDSETRAKTLANAIGGAADADRTVVETYFSNCSRAERKKIIDAYENLYHSDLILDMQNILRKYWTPKFDPIDFAISVTDELPVDLTGKMWVEITSHLPNDYSTIRLILTSLTNDSQTKAISRSFRIHFGLNSEETLLDRVIIDDSKLRSIMESQLNGNRSTNAVDYETVADDAHTIRLAVKTGLWKEDNNVFHNILLTKSYPHLRKVIKFYNHVWEDSLERKIRATFSLDTAEAYIDILQFAENKAEYFAKKLNAAISAISEKHNNTIIRIITYWRAEIDLGNIKRAYQQLYGVSLYDDIKGAIKENFLRNALLAIIGK